MADREERRQHLFEKMLESHVAAAGWAVTIDSGELLEIVSIEEQFLLAERFTRKVKAEMEWLERLIHHRETVGVHYEMILRQSLEEVAPKRFAIATGFILPEYSRRHGKQIDILVYDQLTGAPIYRNGNLVVVRPSVVISASEIKKTLTAEHIRSMIEETFFTNFGTYRNFMKGVQYINIFAFRSRVSIKKIFGIVKNVIEEQISLTKVLHKQTKRAGTLALSHITLPRVFILDENLYVEANLELDKNNDQFAVKINLMKVPSVAGSLGGFMVDSLALDSDQLSLLAPRINAVVDETRVDGYLLLEDRISILQLTKNFPKDRDEILSIRVNEERPTGAFISKGKNWQEFTTFSQFQKATAPHFRNEASVSKMDPLPEVNQT